MKKINQYLKKAGGKYAKYSCKVVSWDDSSRFSSPFGVSCFGSNITDTYLKAKDGTPLFTIRSDNWNEQLGKVSTSDVKVVVGNHVKADNIDPFNPTKVITLREFLENAQKYGKYAGIGNQRSALSNVDLDDECSIRFQTTFLPLEGSSEALEFATEAYNYNTNSDDNPRNLVLLCTTQGVAVQQDGKGTKKLFHHRVDKWGRIHRHWLEAEKSAHAVGGPQKETNEEKIDALVRGKAISETIGIRTMGQRFNVLMTVQIPVKQNSKMEDAFTFGKSASNNGFSFGDGFGEFSGCENSCGDIGGSTNSFSSFSSGKYRGGGASFPPPKGLSSAARLSIGTEHDIWKGLPDKKFEREKKQHITITVVIYNVVQNGTPSPQDLKKAIDDIESLYQATSPSGYKLGKLTDPEFEFMKENGGVQKVDKVVAHVGIHCDGCQSKPIKGVRYKCLICPDYDLCHSCETNCVESKGHHKSHLMLKIRDSSVYKKSALLQARYKLCHPGYYCKYCRKAITGFRRLCTECGADICERCDLAGVHDAKHTILRFGKKIGHPSS